MKITTISLDALANLGRGRIADKDRLRYSLGASASSIEAHLADAKKRLAREQRDVLWLEGLLAERKAQVAAGTWPPPKTEP